MRGPGGLIGEDLVEMFGQADDQRPGQGDGFCPSYNSGTPQKIQFSQRSFHA
jgi:hypothetical protein